MRIIKKMIEIIRDFSEALLKKFKDYEDKKEAIINGLIKKNDDLFKEIADLKAELSKKTLIEKVIIDKIIKEAAELQEVINMLKEEEIEKDVEIESVRAVVEKIEEEVKKQPTIELEKKVEEKKAEIVKEIKTITVSTLGAGNIEVPVEPDSAINRVSVRTRRR